MNMNNSYKAIENLIAETEKLTAAAKDAPVGAIRSMCRKHMKACTDHMSHVRRLLEDLRKVHPRAKGDAQSAPSGRQKTYHVTVRRTPRILYNCTVLAESADEAQGKAIDVSYNLSAPGVLGAVTIHTVERIDDHTIESCNEEIKELIDNDKLVFDLSKLVADSSIDIPIESVVHGLALSMGLQVDVKRIVEELRK